ncbi:MAG: arginase family protein, partial [Solirubrobacterales bacterium]|nr:arginase family protein [Solirubrobacterales bacterium]
LERDGRPVKVAEVQTAEPGAPEIALTFELHRAVGRLVRGAVDEGAFPVVLAGACGSSVGTAAGVGTHDLGVVWLDAHADLDTPEDNLSGFLDVMALTTLTGGAWGALAATVEGFAPVAPERVLLAGVRDLAPYQRDALARSPVRALPGAFTVDELQRALLALPVRRVLLHLDLDVLDAGEGRANRYAAPGGPSLETVLAAVDAVFARFEVAAFALTAYEPGDARAHAAAVALLERVLGHVR